MVGYIGKIIINTTWLTLVIFQLEITYIYQFTHNFIWANEPIEIFEAVVV